MKAQTQFRISILFLFLLLSASHLATVHAEETSVSADSEKADAAIDSAVPSSEMPSSLESAVPATPAEEPIPAPLQAEEPETNTQFRPEVVISKVGEELSLKVKYAHPMDFKNDDAIEYIRMESLTGEFLGLMTLNDKFAEATAEFMINPQLANFDQVRLVAKSSKVGLIKSLHKLEVTPVALPPIPETVKPAEETPIEKRASEKPRKKVLGLF